MFYLCFAYLLILRIKSSICIHKAVCFPAVSSFDIEHGAKLITFAACTTCKSLGDEDLPLISCGPPSSLNR